MGKFRDFYEASGIAQNYSSQPLDIRLQQGKDRGEDYIKAQLRKYGINITPVATAREDITLKIDGYWNGQPVQIKLRRTSRDNRNDIAYELVRNHESSLPLVSQLKTNPGRDFKGQVQHYFVMNAAETHIYYVPAGILKAAILQAIRELGQAMRFQGYLSRPFESTQGVQIRPTRDPDPMSFTPNKVMAFVPVELVKQKEYPIT